MKITAISTASIHGLEMGSVISDVMSKNVHGMLEIVMSLSHKRRCAKATVIGTRLEMDNAIRSAYMTDVSKMMEIVCVALTARGFKLAMEYASKNAKLTLVIMTGEIAE